VKKGQITTARVANIKKHPKQGILCAIEGNPLGFMPNVWVDGKDANEKAARRAFLIANPGTEISVAVIGEPTVQMDKGGPVGRLKLSEQRAVITAKRAAAAKKKAERKAALEATVASLVVGNVYEGTVKGVATKNSVRNPGTMYNYGAFVQIAPGVTGLLHVKQIQGGHRSLEAILAEGTVAVEILSAWIKHGQPRVQLSHSAVG
jgi:ribosomal protein S1